MFSFKPREIRAILILSTLALIGSSITLLKRQGKLGTLDLDIFLDSNRYKYSYNIKDITEGDRVNENAESDVKADTIGERPDDSALIDLNMADFFMLQRLPGIGPVLAERIIAYRDSIGSFETVEDLLRVPGIGESKLADIKDKVTVD